MREPGREREREGGGRERASELVSECLSEYIVNFTHTIP